MSKPLLIILFYLLALRSAVSQTSFYDRLADSAFVLTKQKVQYDPAYFVIAYPNGDIPAGKGVVYIYRESGFVGGGVYGTVTANKIPITKIRNGGYFPYLSNPGTVHFEVSTETTNEAHYSLKQPEK